MLRVEGLSRRFGSRWAVHDVTFSLAPGQVLGFVGPNGAGKTTTIRMLATHLRPDAGQAWIGGDELTARPDRIRRQVGYLPDTFGAYPGTRTGEYLEFFAECHGVARRGREALIRSLLELVDLGPERQTYVDQLSAGMQQRLGLARALVHDPAVLLLDEPGAGLDPHSRREMRELLAELARMGKAVLVSSHILNELAEVCTHIAIVHQGRLLTHGPVAAVLAMASGRLYRVRVLDELGDAVRVLREQPDVVAVAPMGDGIQVRLGTDPAAPVRVLSALMREGVPVTDFAEAGGRLEEVFLQVTRSGTLPARAAAAGQGAGPGPGAGPRAQAGPGVH